MNFDTRAGPLNMPELHWRYGYLFALGLMAATTVAMLYFFRRRNWIGPHSVTFAIDPVRKASRWSARPAEPQPAPSPLAVVPPPPSPPSSPRPPSAPRQGS
jgi:hypothetical protein